jgi:hypothetical protein
VACARGTKRDQDQVFEKSIFSPENSGSQVTETAGSGGFGKTRQMARRIATLTSPLAKRIMIRHLCKAPAKAGVGILSRKRASGKG